MVKTIRSTILVTISMCLITSCTNSNNSTSTEGIIFQKEFVPAHVGGNGVPGGNRNEPDVWELRFARTKDNTGDNVYELPGKAHVTKEQFDSCNIGDWFPDCSRK